MTYYLIGHRIRAMFLLLLTIFIVSACASATDSAHTPKSAVSDPDIIFVGEIGSFPQGCDPQEIVTFVNNFIKTYNAGHTADLEQFWASQFTVYSDGVTEGIQVDPTTYFETSSRDELADYITLRHAQGERLRLLEISVAGPARHGGMAVTFTLAREADDLPTAANTPTRIAIGKGAIACPEKRIFVWSMGTQEPGNIPEIVAQDASYRVAFDELPDKIIVHTRNEEIQ